MRIRMQLSRVEADERNAARTAQPDDPSPIEEAAHEMAEALDMGCDGGPVALDGVDLVDADGSYLYTLAGEPR